MYSIYVHTTPDGRKYVGSTSQEPNRRFGNGLNKYKHCNRFLEAIKLFGWDNIQHQVLETVEEKETALKREEYYTLLWRTNEPEFGYNIYVGYKNEEIRKKISENNKGRKQSEETKKKKSEIQKKPFRLKNKNTGEILMFDSQQSCAKFLSVSNAHISHFINCKRQCKSLKCYEVLK